MGGGVIARGRKTGGRDFKPGDVANPHGRPPLPEDLKRARELTTAEFLAASNRFLFMPFLDLQTFVKTHANPNRPKAEGDPNALEVMCAMLVSKAITDGDHVRINFLLERHVGKVKQAVVVETPQARKRTKESATEQKTRIKSLIKALKILDEDDEG